MNLRSSYDISRAIDALIEFAFREGNKKAVGKQSSEAVTKEKKDEGDEGMPPLEAIPTSSLGEGATSLREPIKDETAPSPSHVDYSTETKWSYPMFVPFPQVPDSTVQRTGYHDYSHLPYPPDAYSSHCVYLRHPRVHLQRKAKTLLGEYIRYCYPHMNVQNIRQIAKHFICENLISTLIQSLEKTDTFYGLDSMLFDFVGKISRENQPCDHCVVYMMEIATFHGGRVEVHEKEGKRKLKKFVPYKGYKNQTSLLEHYTVTINGTNV